MAFLLAPTVAAVIKTPDADEMSPWQQAGAIKLKQKRYFFYYVVNQKGTPEIGWATAPNKHERDRLAMKRVRLSLLLPSILMPAGLRASAHELCFVSSSTEPTARDAGSGLRGVVRELEAGRRQTAQEASSGCGCDDH